MRQLPIIITAIITLAATACSDARIPFVYRIDVPQGNIVTQDMLNQLEVGMEKPRVRYIMGSPMLVDVFHQDRWDYIYLLQPGRGEPKQRRITLHFENERLVRISGDVRASADIAPAQGLRRAQDLEVPIEEDKGILEGLKERVGLGDDEEEESAESSAEESGAQENPSAN